MKGIVPFGRRPILPIMGYGYDMLWLSPRSYTSNNTGLQSQTLGPADKSHLPSFSVLPLVITICVLTTYIIRPFLQHRPKWTRPFVQELSEVPEVLESDDKKRPEHSIIALLIACLAGLTLQLVTAMYPVFHMEALYLAASWVLHPHTRKDYYLQIHADHSMPHSCHRPTKDSSYWVAYNHSWRVRNSGYSPHTCSF